MGRREGVYYYHEILPPLREKLSDWIHKPLNTVVGMVHVILILVVIRLVIDFFLHTKFIKTFLRNKSLKMYFYKIKNQYEGKTALKLDELTDIDLKEKLEILLECREQNLTFHFTSKKKYESLKQIVDLIQKCKQKQFEAELNKNRKVKEFKKIKKGKKSIHGKAKKSKSNSNVMDSENDSENKNVHEDSSRSRKKTKKKKDYKNRNKNEDNTENDKEESNEEEKNDKGESDNEKSKKVYKKNKEEKDNDGGDEVDDDNEKSDPNTNPSILLDVTQEFDEKKLNDLYLMRDLVSCKSEDDFFNNNFPENNKNDLIVKLLNKSIRKRPSVVEPKKNANRQNDEQFLILEDTQEESGLLDKNTVKFVKGKNAPKKQADFWIIKNMDDINDEISK